MSSLHVKVFDKAVGDLLKEDSAYVFRYIDAKEKDFISLSMPVRAKSYVHTKLHPIFEMHLPEGYLLSIIKKHFSKLVKTDDYGLLRLMSSNIYGRLSYQNKEDKSATYNLTLEDLKHPQSEQLFSELVAKFALTSALSGVQPKVLAEVTNSATLMTENYIVKSWGEEYQELALNEFYCMSIVKDANISVPEFYISDDEKLFIMKRFDIVNDVPLGFEDMCVLQAKQRDDKYEGSYEKIAKTIKTFVSSKHKKKSLLEFYKILVVSTFVQNGDAHLKNFGLLYRDIDSIKLAPAYDVVCTSLYIENDIMALNLLGSKKWWDKKYLIRFAVESCDLSKQEANLAYEECLKALEKNISIMQRRIAVEENSKKKEIVKKLVKIFSKALV